MKITLGDTSNPRVAFRELEEKDLDFLQRLLAGPGEHRLKVRSRASDALLERLTPEQRARLQVTYAEDAKP